MRKTEQSFYMLQNGGDDVTHYARV